MIEVIYPQNYRMCNVCGNKAFREYAFRCGNQGMIVALCRKCVCELHELTDYPMQENGMEAK